VAAFVWIRWPLSIGLGGRFPSESVAALPWIPQPEVCDTLNSSLSGWSNYFCHGTRSSAFRSVDRYVYERVRDFLAGRHKMAGRGTRRFSFDVVYGKLGLLRLERLPRNAPPCASR
jgi:RNA-directed DNA polymerase